MSEQQTILVAGANGTTGRHIINTLKESSDYQPVAMIRKPEQADFFEHQNVKTMLADLEDQNSYSLNNIDGVIFAAGSKGKNLIAVDQEGAKKMVDAAAQANVDKFVMLSSMGADKPGIGGDLEAYLRAKQSADDHLRLSSLDYSIIRPGMLTDEPGTGQIQLKEQLNQQGNISREDVAQTLVAALDKNTLPQQAVEILSGDTPIIKALKTF